MLVVVVFSVLSAGMVRKLKHHEQKLLKKVDFIDWKDNGLQENKVMSKFAVRKREEYTYYNKLSREVYFNQTLFF